MNHQRFHSLCHLQITLITYRWSMKVRLRDLLSFIHWFFHPYMAHGRMEKSVNKGYSVQLHIHMCSYKCVHLCLSVRLFLRHVLNHCTPPHLIVHGWTRSAYLGLQDGWPGEVTLNGLGLLSGGPHMHLGASSVSADQPAWDVPTPIQSICMSFFLQGSDWDRARPTAMPRGQKCSWGPTQK